MKNKNTLLYQITETSQYMMAFVIVTRENNAIVIDGGRPEDIPLLKKYIGGRHISAWILTHAHDDHISGLLAEIRRDGAKDFDIERICYNFPPLAWRDIKDVPNSDYFKVEIEEMLPEFYELLPRFKDKTQILYKGDRLTVDEVQIDVLYHWRDGLYANPINDSSLVFKLSTPNTSVLFLGDIGPDAGDILFRESRELLRSDIVQMAHHGHMNPSFEVYAAISPRVCLWCCPDGLYNEPILPPHLADGEKMRKFGRIRMYGTMLTRSWMDILGVKEHYVTKDGTHEIII